MPHREAYGGTGKQGHVPVICFYSYIHTGRIVSIETTSPVHIHTDVLCTYVFGDCYTEKREAGAALKGHPSERCDKQQAEVPETLTSKGKAVTGDKARALLIIQPLSWTLLGLGPTGEVVWE